MELKNRKADDMCYKRIRFHFLSISILIFGLTLAGCSKDEILDQYNSVVQTAGNAALTSNFLLKGNRTYGEDCYTGTYTADYKDFSKTEYLFGGTSIERENGKDISVSCDLEIRAFRNEYRIIICRTTAKEKSCRQAEAFSHAYSYTVAFEKSKPPFLLDSVYTR